jgi:flagellar motor switch protein FliN/FliY
VNVPVLHKNPMGAAAGPLTPMAAPVDVSRVLRLEVPVIVRLADRKLTLSEVMRLGVGAIIEFVKSSSEPLELLINNKVIGYGETVKVGENFGLRITSIGDVKQVIRAMGGSPGK